MQACQAKQPKPAGPPLATSIMWFDKSNEYQSTSIEMRINGLWNYSSCDKALQPKGPVNELTMLGKNYIFDTKYLGNSWALEDYYRKNSRNIKEKRKHFHQILKV